MSLFGRHFSTNSMSSWIFVVVLRRSSAHARRATNRILPAVAGFRCPAAAVHRSAAGSWPRVGPSSGPGPGPAWPALLERLSSRRRRQARFLAVRHEEDINLSEGRQHFKATPLTTRRRLLTDETRPPAYFSDQRTRVARNLVTIPVTSLSDIMYRCRTRCPCFLISTTACVQVKRDPPNNRRVLRCADNGHSLTQIQL